MNRIYRIKQQILFRLDSKIFILFIPVIFVFESFIAFYFAHIV